jgi:hypothetical protein
MMERFGPMRGWWAFPFERFNGQIQHLSTNHKVGLCPPVYFISDQNLMSQPSGEVEKRFLTQWLRSAKVHALLASQTIPGVSPLADLANEMLHLNVPLALSLLDESPGITFLSGVHHISKETRAALVADGITTILRNVKVLAKVVLRQSEFEPYKYSRKNGFVEFSPTDQATQEFWPVGYIHELFLYHQENQECPSILACIAQCIKVDDRFLDNRQELGARLCGRDIVRYVLVPLKQLAHVVRYSWNSSTQLVISTHNPPTSTQ